VRDAAGQLPDGFHLLRLIELPLEALAIRKHRGELRFAFAQRFRRAAFRLARRHGHPGTPFSAVREFNHVLAARVRPKERRDERARFGVGVDDMEPDRLLMIGGGHGRLTQLERPARRRR